MCNASVVLPVTLQNRLFHAFFKYRPRLNLLELSQLGVECTHAGHPRISEISFTTTLNTSPVNKSIHQSINK